MPKVRRSKKPPPEGWELIEPTLEELEQKMREGQLKFYSLYIIVIYQMFYLEKFLIFFLFFEIF